MSRNGVLLAFEEPIGFETGHRLLVSIDAADTHFHSIAQVVRCERGTDFRSYIAVEFVGYRTEDMDDLLQCVENDDASEDAGDVPVEPKWRAR